MLIKTSEISNNISLTDSGQRIGFHFWNYKASVLVEINNSSPTSKRRGGKIYTLGMLCQRSAISELVLQMIMAVVNLIFMGCSILITLCLTKWSYIIDNKKLSNCVVIVSKLILQIINIEWWISFPLGAQYLLPLCPTKLSLVYNLVCLSCRWGSYTFSTGSSGQYFSQLISQNFTCWFSRSAGFSYLKVALWLQVKKNIFSSCKTNKKYCCF